MSKNVRLIGVKEVARILGCSPTIARNIMKRPDFPLVKVGRELKVNEDSFVEWTKRRRM